MPRLRLCVYVWVTYSTNSFSAQRTSGWSALWIELSFSLVWFCDSFGIGGTRHTGCWKMDEAVKPRSLPGVRLGWAPSRTKLCAGVSGSVALLVGTGPSLSFFSHHDSTLHHQYSSLHSWCGPLPASEQQHLDATFNLGVELASLHLMIRSLGATVQCCTGFSTFGGKPRR